MRQFAGPILNHGDKYSDSFLSVTVLTDITKIISWLPWECLVMSGDTDGEGRYRISSKGDWL